MKTFPKCLLAGAFATAFLGAAVLRGDGIVFHADLIPQDLSDYILSQQQTAADQAQQQQEANKLSTQNAIDGEFGPPAPSTLQAGSLPASATALSADVPVLQNTIKSTSDASLSSYLTWSIANRAAIGGVNQQIANLISQNNGQPLDYSHQVLMASQMGALRNQSLTLAITDQNTANETRVQYALAKQQMMENERTDDLRDHAQAALNARLQR